MQISIFDTVTVAISVVSVVIAVVSAVIAALSHQRAKESNTIATRAIDEQLRPQLILIVEKILIEGNSREEIFVKNIGNASAMNILIKINKPTKDNLNMVANIGQPSVLYISEKRLLVVLPKDQDMSTLAGRLNFTLGSTLISDSSYNKTPHKITVKYEDISGQRSYTSIFSTLIGGIRHESTTCS